MASSQSQKPQGLPNPYATKGVLPNPYAPAVESAPVPTEEQAKAAAQKKTAFHNPHKINRPQPKNAQTVKRPMAMPAMPKTAKLPSSSSDADPAPTDEPRNSVPKEMRTLEYWQSTAQDDAETLEWSRQKDRERKQQQKDRKKFAKGHGYWNPDASYKPRVVTNYQAYPNTKAWRYKRIDFLNFVKRQCPSRPSSSKSPESERLVAADTRPSPKAPSPRASPKAAPKLSFAPPASYDQDPPRRQSIEERAAAVPPPPAPSVRRADVTPPPPTTPAPSPPAPLPSHQPADVAPPPSSVSAPYNPTISAPPVRYSHVIEAAPVRYATATGKTKNAGEERAAKRQKMTKPEPVKSKAELMMEKMGYQKGKGLGKNQDGVTQHLEVKMRPKMRNDVPPSDDHDNGKRIKSAQVYDILGGTLAKPKEPDRFGEVSKVIAVWGCLQDIDWTADADRNDGGIRQELGDTFDVKFGRIERIHISGQEPVYVKFVSEMSALNAVNRFAEGYKIRGRKVIALHYSEAKFDQSVFDH